MIMNLEIFRRLESRANRYTELARKRLNECAQDPGNRYAKELCEKALEDAQAAVFILELSRREMATKEVTDDELEAAVRKNIGR